MRWRIHTKNPDTQQRTVIYIEAFGEQDAKNEAHRLGIWPIYGVVRGGPPVWGRVWFVLGAACFFAPLLTMVKFPPNYAITVIFASFFGAAIRVVLLGPPFFLLAWLLRRFKNRRPWDSWVVFGFATLFSLNWITAILGNEFVFSTVVLATPATSLLMGCWEPD